MQYTMIEELHTPAKVYKSIYAFDLIFIIFFSMGLFFLGQDRVHQHLTFVYMAFNVLVAFILTWHSPFNPQKRIFQSLFYAVRKDRAAYQPVQLESSEEEMMTTAYFEKGEES